jgi:hypothetical protein
MDTPGIKLSVDERVLVKMHVAFATYELSKPLIRI